MTKKRKLEEHYEEDREPAAYGTEQQGAAQHSSGSRVEAETVSYLQEVAQHFSSIVDPEERELLVANVLEEIQGKELRIACDAVTSRLLEQLLSGAPSSQLVQFMQAFTNEDMMFSLAGSAFGSHVAEKVLAGLHNQAEQQQQQPEGQEGEEDPLQELLSGMVGAIGGHLYDYVMDKHATHVARALLVVIAGRDVLSPVTKKKQQHQQQPEEVEEGTVAAAAAAAAAGNQQAFKSTKSSLQEKLEGSRAGSAAGGRSGPPPVRFPALLRRYAKMLPCYYAANMALLGKDSYASPFIQAMLRAAAGDEELLLLLLPPILGVDAAKASAAAPGSLLSTLTDSHMGRLLRDHCYSHLLEVAVAVMPQGLAAEFQQRFLRGRLLPLANHHSANFVVQAWLAAASSAHQVQEVLDELQNQLADLLQRRRSGVVAALVAAAGRVGGPQQQAAAVAALIAALSGLPQWQGRQGTDHLAPALLTLDTNATMGSSSSSANPQQHHQQHHQPHSYGSSTRLSTPGAAILATLFTSYPRKVVRPFIASLISLAPADAARAAKDPAGSRALQALIEGSAAGSSDKQALLERLSGCWGDVALQGAGSFFLEKAYAWADLDAKEGIVRDVAARQGTLLAGCPWGTLLARKLGLEAYARSPEEWRKRASSAAAAKRAFEQMLEDEAPPAAAAAAGDGNAGKKRKRQQQVTDAGGGAAEGTAVAAAAAGGGGSSSKKERKRAKLAAAGAAEQEPPAAAADGDAVAQHGSKKEKHKKRKHLEDEHAAAASEGPGSNNKPKKKKHKAAKQAAAEEAEQEEGPKGKKSKRKRHSSPPAAAGGGSSSTADFVALLGFGGLGGGEAGNKPGSKRHRK